MPRRFQDYSIDLRAMVVFNTLMVLLLAPGDVAVDAETFGSIGRVRVVVRDIG
jgi:hypothetical protein